MPIRPENRALYPSPARWREIVALVRLRSHDRCEGSPAYPNCRAANRQPHPETGSRVVLTTAHLDHDPRNCALANLRHWCQRCHLTYDAAHHARNAATTRRRRRHADQLEIAAP